MRAVPGGGPAIAPDVEELLGEARALSAARAIDREQTVELISAALFACVATALAVLVPSSVSTPLPVAFAVLAVYALASRVEFAVASGYTVPTQLAFVPMLFLLPLGLVPVAVVLAQLVAKLPAHAGGRIHPARAFLAISDGWHAVGPVLVLWAAGIDDPALSHWPVFLLALAAQFVVDGVASLVRACVGIGAPARVVIEELLWIDAVDAMLAPIGLLAAITAVDEPAGVLLVLPLIGLLALFARERTSRIEHALELSSAYRGTALMLGDVVEADDQYTGDHSRGVVSLALSVGARIGLDAQDRRQLEFAALLHDIGKLAIPKEIIRKPGALTDEEFELVKTHTIEGHRMLTRVGGLLARVGVIVRSCHERWDGRGYPDGLAGEQIPLAARIIFACDAYNAMTTDRSYRKAMPAEEAIAELRGNAGSQFDPAVVDVLLEVLER